MSVSCLPFRRAQRSNQAAPRRCPPAQPHAPTAPAADNYGGQQALTFVASGLSRSLFLIPSYYFHRIAIYIQTYIHTCSSPDPCSHNTQ
jgi:hypothetical protein